MRYTVGYRGFQIVRDSPDEPYRILKNDKPASHVKFWTFGDARRECDSLRGDGAFNDEDE